MSHHSEPNAHSTITHDDAAISSPSYSVPSAEGTGIERESSNTPEQIRGTASEGVYTAGPVTGDAHIEDAHIRDAHIRDATTDHSTQSGVHHHAEHEKNGDSALKRDWEQTKADLPGMHGKDTGQSITDTIRGKVSDAE